jgi:hypothetical protein
MRCAKLAREELLQPRTGTGGSNERDANNLPKPQDGVSENVVSVFCLGFLGPGMMRKGNRIPKGKAKGSLK